MTDHTQQRQQDQRLEQLETLEDGPVAARYTTNAGQSIANNTLTIIDYGTRDFDTRDAVTTGASWQFAAPVGGYYAVTAQVAFVASDTFNVSGDLTLGIYVNGVERATAFGENWNGVAGVSSIGPAPMVSDVIHLDAGDLVDARVKQTAGSTRALKTTTEFTLNRISIIKV